MTDRELLELAAKAAGINLQWMGGAVEVRDGIITAWNPLYDDGDAFRLAVKMRIDVCYENNDGPWHVNAWPRMAHAGCSEIAEESASTRRAIVRAAAEIGKEMK